MKIWEPTERTKALVSSMTRAQIERARLSTRLLSVEPKLTATEVGVLWFGCRALMEKADSERRPATEDAVWREFQVVSDIAKEYFDHYCQNFIRDVCRSSLDLVNDRDAIKDGVKPFFDADVDERRALFIPLFGKLTANSLKLAAATIDVASANLTPWEKRKARLYAKSLIARENGLDQFEVETASRTTFNAFT